MMILEFNDLKWKARDTTINASSYQEVKSLNTHGMVIAYTFQHYNRNIAKLGVGLF